MPKELHNQIGDSGQPCLEAPCQWYFWPADQQYSAAFLERSPHLSACFVSSYSVPW